MRQLFTRALCLQCRYLFINAYLSFLYPLYILDYKKAHCHKSQNSPLKSNSLSSIHHFIQANNSILPTRSLMKYIALVTFISENCFEQECLVLGKLISEWAKCVDSIRAGRKLVLTRGDVYVGIDLEAEAFQLSGLRKPLQIENGPVFVL